ncbi:MAG: hypothetical protein RIC35_07195 [Marinoscillum sp.]
MKIKYLAVIILLCANLISYAQEWVALDTINFNERITAYSIDPDNRIYIGTATGSLYRYEPNGQESEYYSAIANFSVTSVAAWNRFKVFVFYQNPQEFYFLDRFNTVSNSYDISEYSKDLINQCTPGVDNSLWMLSASYNELRKYNQQSKQLLFSNPLDMDVSSVSHMRAFQNLLIISDREEGLKFFDQFGNLLTEVGFEKIDHFQISGGKLIFYSSDYVHSIDPFNPGADETIKAPNGAFIGLLKYEEDYFFIQGNRILIFRRG